MYLVMIVGLSDSDPSLPNWSRALGQLIKSKADMALLTIAELMKNEMIWTAKLNV